MMKETGQLIRRLDGALSAPNRVNVFADLKNQRQRTTAVRNRATSLRRDLLAVLSTKAKAASGELAQVRDERDLLLVLARELHLHMMVAPPSTAIGRPAR